MRKPSGTGSRRRRAAPAPAGGTGIPENRLEAVPSMPFPTEILRAPERLPDALRTDTERLRRLVGAAFEGLGENTLRAYSRAWDDFARHAGAPSRDDAARLLALGGQARANELALTWRAALERRGLSTATVSLRISALRSMISRLRLTGALSFELDVRAPRVQGYRDTAGPGKEKVLEAIAELRRRTGARAARDLAILHLLWSCGLRVSEATGLDLEHLDGEKRRAFILGKGRRDREPVDVPPGSWETLEAWVRHRGPWPGPLFTPCPPGRNGKPCRLTARQVRRITHGLGLGRPHGIRHTAITEALEKTRDPRLVQRFSRHRDLGTLMVYDDNRKRLGGEVARLLDREARPGGPGGP